MIYWVGPTMGCHRNKRPLYFIAPHCQNVHTFGSVLFRW